MDIKIVEAFQMLGSGVMDIFFGAFYYLLNPLFTMLIPIILFYAVDKKLAYRTGVFYGITSFFCGTFKEIIRRDRPFVAHPDKVAPRIEDKASGASMPSGHAMGVIGLLYPATKQHALGEKKRNWLLIVSIVVAVLVGFSRVYMAGHYLTDVVAGWVLGLAIAIGIDFALTKLGDKFYLFGLLILPVMLILIIILPESDSCAVGMAFTAAILIGGFLDHKFVNLNTDTKVWVKILRIFIALSGAFILGLAVVSKVFEAGLGYSVSDIGEFMPIELASKGLDTASINRTVKSVASIAYFSMFFVANAWAFIACPYIFKYLPILWNKLFKKEKNASN